MILREQKVKFGTRFNRPDVTPSDRGTAMRDIFEERIVDGSKELVVTGQENFKDFIEASKAETQIENIIKRFQMGDINALSRAQGFYADITGMPNNLAEAQNMLIKMENDFNSLSVDIKKKFDNSFDKYVSMVSNTTVDGFKDLFNLNDKVENKEVVEDVIE